MRTETITRDIVSIDENLCDGCGLCVPNCHEGALQIIDGKARLISDLMCDGLGACLGHCPQGAITIEKREAEPYDEVAVMKEMVKSGKNVVVAHLRHLKEHNEKEFMLQGVGWLRDNQHLLSFSLMDVIDEVHNEKQEDSCHSGGCPGSKTKTFNVSLPENAPSSADLKSSLTHWPIQLHLISPGASHFRGSDLLIAADCSAFSFGNFHQKFLTGKTMIIACPKLDDGLDVYVDKIRRLVDESRVNTITVVIMEVPCCGGLLQIVKSALSKAQRKVPVKSIVLGIQGDILQEEWV